MGVILDLNRLRSSYTAQYIALSVAPHTGTTRATIAGMAGVYLYVDRLYIRVSRATAASTLGHVHALISYTPSGGTARSMAGVYHYNNTVGHTIYEVYDIGLPLRSGDVMEIQTADSSTGGTCDYYITLTYYMV